MGYIAKGNVILKVEFLWSIAGKLTAVMHGNRKEFLRAGKIAKA